MQEKKEKFLLQNERFNTYLTLHKNKHTKTKRSQQQPQHTKHHHHPEPKTKQTKHTKEKNTIFPIPKKTTITPKQT